MSDYTAVGKDDQVSHHRHPNNTSEMTPFGFFVKKALKARGLSMREFAAALGVHDSAVYHWFYGKASPQKDRVPVIAQTLGVSEAAVRNAIGNRVDRRTLPKAQRADHTVEAPRRGRTPKVRRDVDADDTGELFGKLIELINVSKEFERVTSEIRKIMRR
jgi:transcriptional regulator with XRE-family HTH domain